MRISFSISLKCLVEYSSDLQRFVMITQTNYSTSLYTTTHIHSSSAKMSTMSSAYRSLGQSRERAAIKVLPTLSTDHMDTFSKCTRSDRRMLSFERTSAVHDGSSSKDEAVR